MAVHIFENLYVARCRHDYGLRTSLAKEVKGQMLIVTVLPHVSAQPGVLSWGHVIVLQRGDVPAGLWHSYGVTSLCHSGQPGDGGRRAKGSHFLHNPTTLLEAVRG